MENNSELAIIRSNLQYYCDDLQNLIISDLEECKWPIKRRIFLSLFAKSPSLTDYFQELESIDFSRSEEQRNLKLKPVSKEIKIQQEHTYRTKFLQTVLDGCTYLKWPPAFEAFTDTLRLLMEDVPTVISAIKFILDVASPQQHFTGDMPGSCQKNFSTKSPSKVVHNSIEKQKLIASEKMKTKDSSHKIDCNVEDLTHRTMTSPLSARSVSKTPRNPRMTPGQPCSRQSLNHQDYESLARSYKILLHHNEQLSKQLKQLQEAVIAKESTENKIELMIRDLRILLIASEDTHEKQLSTDEPIQLRQRDNRTNRHDQQQQPNLGSHDSHNAILAGGPYNEDDVVWDDCDVPSTNGNDRTDRTSTNPVSAANLKSRKSGTEAVTGGVGSGGSRSRSQSVDRRDRAIASNSSNSSTNTTNHVVGKTQSSSSLAAETLRSRSSQEVGRLTGNQPISRPPRKPNNLPPTEQKQPASNSLSLAYISRLRAQLSGLEAQWVAAKRQASSCIWSRISLLPEEETRIRSFLKAPSKKNPMTAAQPSDHQNSHRPGDILIHQLFGLHPPVTLHPYSQQTSSSGNSSTTHTNRHDNYDTDGVGLDIIRIHSLQRSLVDFISNTTEIITICQKHEENNYRGGQDPPLSLTDWPLSESSVQLTKKMTQLRGFASDLQLSLACLGPLSPLTIRDIALQSSFTGLEILGQEILKVPNILKSTTTMSTIQQAMDRAKKEQVALALELRTNRNQLRSWADAASSLVNRMSIFGDSINTHFETVKDDVKGICEVMTAVKDAIVHARSSTIRNNNDVSIRPFEVLKKGSMGPEIANFIVTIDSYVEDISGYSQKLNEFQSRIQIDMDSELRKLKSTTREIEYAVEIMEKK